MKKGGLSHVGVYALVTFLVLVLIAVVFYVYVKERTSHIEARGLRTLGAVSNSLSQKIGALKRPVLEVAQELEDHKNLDQEQIEEFLLLHFRKIKGIGNINPNEDLIITRVNGEHEEENENITLRVTKSRLEIAWNYRLDHATVNASEPAHFHIKLELPIDRAFLFENMIYREFFEHIFVVHHLPGSQEAPETIFKYNRNESRIHRIDQLKSLDEEAWTFTDFALQSSMADVALANQPYKLFSQPVTINELTGGGESARGTPWVIVGLMDKTRMEREARSFSPNVAVFLLMILLFGIFTLPIIKLHYINVDDNLDLPEVFSVCLSLFLGISLITLIAVDVISYAYLRARTDQNLSQTANVIKTRFGRELNQAFTQLDALDRIRLPPEQTAGQTSENQIFNMLSVIPEIDPLALHYPYLKMTLWTNEKGEQTERWKTKGTPTPLINVRKREYFSKILEGDTLSHPDFDGGFFLQPLFSWTTGNFEVVLSKETRSMGGEAFDGVAALVLRFVSLDEPVMPDGMGFAVINQEGLVLFHTETGRNLQENFFNECEDNKALQAAVFSGVTQKLNANYMGSAYRFHVTPLHESLPWRLITFQDKLHDRSFNLVAFTQVALLFLVHAGVMVAFLFLFVLFFPRGRFTLRRQWLWPAEQYAPVYLELCLIYGVLILGALFNLRSGRQDMALGAVFFSGALIVFLTFFKLERRQHRLAINWSTARNTFVYLILISFLAMPLHGAEETIFGFPPLLFYPLFAVPLTMLVFPIVPRGFWTHHFRKIYVCAFALFLCAAFLLPVITFWKLAFEFETGLMSRYVQLRFMEDLEERDRRLSAKRIKDLERFASAGEKFSTVIENTISNAEQKIYSYDADFQQKGPPAALEETRGPLTFVPEFNQTDDGPLRTVLEARGSFTFPIKFPNFRAESSVATNHVYDYQFDIYPVSPFLGKITEYGSLAKPEEKSRKADRGSLFLASWIPAFNPVTNGQRFLVKDSAKGRGFFWQRENGWLTLTNQNPNTRGKHYVITLDAFGFGDAFLMQLARLLRNPLVLAILLVLASVVLFLFYKVLDFVVGKLFMLDLQPIPPISAHQLIQIINGRHHRAMETGHYLILGSKIPDTWLNSTNGPTPASDWDVLDFTKEHQIDTLPEWPAQTAKLYEDSQKPLVIHPFDYIHPSKVEHRCLIDKRKFQLIERLLEIKPRLIIFSAYDPVVFNEDHLHALRANPNENKGDKAGEQQPKAGETTDPLNWQKLLAGFHNLSFAGDECENIRSQPAAIPDHLPTRREPGFVPPSRGTTTLPVEKVLERECRHMPYLRMLGDFTALEHIEHPDQILSELGDIFKGYYHQIWAKCGKRERWILFDLAHDGFANPANGETIRYLIKKRLVIRNDSIRIVNETFRRFILEHFRKEDIPPRQEPQRLSWGVLKIPVFMVLLFGSTFFILTQQELSKLFVTLSSTILLGIIPTLLKSFGLLKQSP